MVSWTSTATIWTAAVLDAESRQQGFGGTIPSAGIGGNEQAAAVAAVQGGVAEADGDAAVGGLSEDTLLADVATAVAVA